MAYVTDALAVPIGAVVHESVCRMFVCTSLSLSREISDQSIAIRFMSVETLSIKHLKIDFMDEGHPPCLRHFLGSSEIF